MKNFVEVSRSHVIHEFIAQEGQFIVYSLFNRQPVEGTKERSDMGRLTTAKNETCSMILNFLKLLQKILGASS